MMKKIEQKVLKFIDEKKLINRNDRVLTGLSGGPDSVFLLYFLHKYSRRLKISVGALHINHLLRGKEADRDERFCRLLTNKLGVKYFSVKRNTDSFARKSGISIEEAGRIIRYKEFQKFSDKHNYNKIATAHNSDDNAETVLLNLIKGAGLKGISGIPFRRENIIRPILVLIKKEILDYLNYKGINYRTDLSNLDDNYERNFLRNNIIPLIQKKLNPSVLSSIFKSSEVFKELNSFIKNKTESVYSDIVEKETGLICISINKLEKVDKELKSELFRSIFEKEFDYQLSFDECKKIFTLITKQTGKSINLAAGIKAFKDRGKIIFTAAQKTEFEPIKLKAGQSVKINNRSLSIKQVRQAKINYDQVDIEFINGEKIKKDFILRRWENGDRFIPFGMKGKKKLSDFLNEQKLSSYKKKEQLILENDKKIVWVVGLRLDDRFKVLPDTKNIYKLRLS